MLAGVEAGGTKMVCAVGPDPFAIRRRAVIRTEEPAATLAAIVAFLQDRSPGEARLRGIGIGSFGPLQLDAAAADYGAIGRTPKAGWSGINLRTALRAALQCDVAIDTDVNASGLAEAAAGIGRGLQTLAYVTIGTGIGGALIVGGRPLLGLTHPEMGHIRPRRHPEDTAFAGSCPFHGDCMEGLASGTAIQARTGSNLSELAADHPVWRIVGDYLGQLCATLVLMCSPERIVLGGGVMAANPRLFAYVRPAAQRWLAGYVCTPALDDAIGDYIVAPGLGEHAGIVGALMMARDQAAAADGR